LPKRVIHQDMKLANMLFDKSGKNLISVVDWDTIDL
jgi:aminoglycoside phosphotransferase (APT) family kinase protein